MGVGTGVVFVLLVLVFHALVGIHIPKPLNPKP